MKLYIKNMVCNRCISAVAAEFEKLAIPVNEIVLGEVTIEKKLSDDTLITLNKRLISLGFEMLDDSRKKIIEGIKNVVVKFIHYPEDRRTQNFSEILSRGLNKDYSFLSNLFSEVEGITIEKYIINQKIERAKELIIYDQMNLSEIAFELGYSSVAYLSAQFKKVTGITPSRFKAMGDKKRKAIDTV
jgi:AraC-like DNA-binding protein